MNTPYTSLIIGLLDLLFRTASLLLCYYLLLARLSKQPFVEEQAPFFSGF
jgi:hypothetical protein